MKYLNVLTYPKNQDILSIVFEQVYVMSLLSVLHKIFFLSILNTSTSFKIPYF